MNLAGYCKVDVEPCSDGALAHEGALLQAVWVLCL